MMPRTGSLALKEPIFDRTVSDKYQGLQMFPKHFMTNTYNAQENDKVPIILKWPGRERLQFIQMLNYDEQDKCKTVQGS